MLLKLTRLAQKATESSEHHLGIADWIVMYRTGYRYTAIGKQNRQQQKQTKQVVLPKHLRAYYNEDQVGIVEQLCIEDQAALKGGYRYSHSSLQIAIVDYMQVAIVDYRQPQYTTISHSKLQVRSHSTLQVAIVDYRQPQETTGSHSRLQVAIVRYRQPQQITGNHSRLQVGIVDYRQACSYSYRRLERHSSLRKHSSFTCTIGQVHLLVLLYLLYKAKKLSLHLTVMPISQQCQHRSKPDLLEMKAESSGTSEYIFISLNVPVFIHTSVHKAVV